jgi:hypothetical protein
MRNSWATKLLVGAAALVVLIGIILNFFNRSPRTPTNTPPAISQKPESAPPRNFSGRSQPSTPEEESPTQADDQLAQFLALKLPREKIQEYLTLHHRDAASLLAAFYASGDAEHPSGDINYLKEAATNYPTDPHVQQTVLSQNLFPEDHRKWLDAFKSSSPGNSFADYLSAEDYFKNGRPELAVKELLAATAKSQFENFAMETLLNEEALYRFAGKSAYDANVASMAAMAGGELPDLATVKRIAQGARDFQKQYVDAGDAASAENLSQMTIALANRLSNGESGKFLINQLVGIATEAIGLQNLNQSTSYEFLGGKTPAERTDELKQERASIKELTKGLHPVFSAMSEAERVSYWERVKIYGELEAMRWLQQQHSSPAPRQGN